MANVTPLSDLSTTSIVDTVLSTRPPGAPTVVMLLHGRGGAAEPFVSWIQTVVPTAWLIAPQAASHSWYPYRFTVPRADNQPYLDESLRAIGDLVSYVTSRGYRHKNIILAGFSQGACLASEYVKQSEQSYGGLVAMSGGLIGTDDDVAHGEVYDYGHIPIYIGCDEADPHIPWSRVEQTAAYFTSRAAAVQCRRYRGIGHQIHPDAITFLQQLVV